MLTLFTLPGLALLLAFQYYPLLGNVIAFKDYLPFLGVWDSPWVGLDNFAPLISGDPRFMNALLNTLLITLVQTVVAFPVPIMLALALNALVSERVKRVVQSILYLPHFLSWVIVVALFQQFLGGSGLINNTLRASGLDPIHIIGNPDVFIALLTAQVTWKDAGWAMILFLAALSRIDAELYEAAAVDGASRGRQLWHITLPGLRGIVVLLLILKLGDSLSVGFEQLILQQAAVGLDAAEVLDTYVYNNGIAGGNWGQSAAVGLVKGIVGVVLVLSANKVAHLFGEDGVYKR
ncbi:ABC transporter permease [Pseudactinotalea suaedae]|uniref:ABC transporter permease n=1 Tax=Pseudactinotalea suaedae TaxID=1524924 RepID=UPI001F4F3FD3|nr:ABC transporter permease subunit [Pseudactinotalea suaedae]